MTPFTQQGPDYSLTRFRLLRKNPWVWTVLTIIPIVNLIAWGRILWLAAQTLRANGIPCGFMGADQAALNRLGKTV